MRVLPLGIALTLCTAAAWAQAPAGGEVRINSATTGDQFSPGVARGADGRFVVVWDDENDFVAKGQRFDAAGARVGAEFTVSDGPSSVVPRVALQRNGGFVVAWIHFSDGDSAGVHARRFDAAGNKLGSELLVNTYTTGFQAGGSMAFDPQGNFVVAWDSDLPGGSGAMLQRFDAQGARLGAEFQANTYTTGFVLDVGVAADPAGGFFVTWTQIPGLDGSGESVQAQRYAPGGVPRGANFVVNSYTTGDEANASAAFAPDGTLVVAYHSGSNGIVVWAKRYDAAGNPLGADFMVSPSAAQQRAPSVAVDRAGGFVVAWHEAPGDGSVSGVRARRFLANGTPRGADFLVNTYTTGNQQPSPSRAIASDGAGNFVVSWDSITPSGYDVFLQRFGGLHPTALQVDAAGNSVWEPGETVNVAPTWRNVTGVAQQPTATLSSLGGPPGATYTIPDGSAVYPSIANNGSAACTDCYQVALSNPPVRPVLHWDATAAERLAPEAQGQIQLWTLHVGGSFTDVPAASGFYRSVETLLHRGVTAGCGGSSFCPGASTSRAQMAVFLLLAKENSGFTPPACTAPVFGDVPASSPFCRYVEELARRGVTSGCGGGNYCPDDAVTRDQMAVFLLRTLDPALLPPACTVPLFADVPASSPFCRWVEELARRGITSGCGGGNYCPTQPVTREQMAVFLTTTFGLTLYGP